MNNNYSWSSDFQKLFSRAVKNYRAGQNRAETLFGDEDRRFLSAIGASTQEITDFVEDFCRDGEPDFELTLLITAVRRDYFLVEQKGKPSGRTIEMSQLPPKDASLDGIAWLPRIIRKAEAKLRGEMPPELMYGCGGDRPFLKSVNVHPADFLRVVWATKGDDGKILKYVRQESSNKSRT